MPICSRSDLHADVAHINAIDLDRAAGHIIETWDQVDDGGLAGACRTDDGNGLPGLGSEGDILQHRHAVFIGMRCILEFNQSLDLRHFLRGRFIVHGRFFIENGEDAFRAGDGVLNIRPQHRDLLDGLVEALDICQEGHDQTKGDRCAKESLSSEQIPATHTCDDRQRNIG